MIFSLSLLFLTCQPSEQGLTDEFIDSLLEQGLYYDFVAVRRINYTLKSMEELDTIAYSRIREKLVYSYNGEVLDDPFDNAAPNEPVRIFYNAVHGSWGVRLHIDRMTKEGKKETIFVESSSTAQSSKSVLKHFVDGVANGRYLEQSLSGTTLVEGYYNQIDSSWQDAISSVDPETYDVKYTFVTRDKFAVKVGRWLYRNEEGDTIRIEEYRNIK